MSKDRTTRCPKAGQLCPRTGQNCPVPRRVSTSEPERRQSVPNPGSCVHEQDAIRLARHMLIYSCGLSRETKPKPKTKDKHMPKIENKTIIKHAQPICDALNKIGKNWTAKAQAAVIVKVVLEEMGATEQLGEEFLADRQAVIALVEKFGYPKNFQNSYLAKTMQADGKTPMMPEVSKTDEVEINEFA